MPASKMVEVPLTTQDKKWLRAHSPRGDLGESLWSAATVTGMIWGLAFLAVLLGWHWFVPIGNPYDNKNWIAFGTLVPSLWYCRAMWLDLFTAFTPSEHPSAAEQDRTKGTAYSLATDVNRAVEIQEYEDEGAGFLLELADGRVLALVSQDLYEFAHDYEHEDGEGDRSDGFPQTRIEYRYAPISGLSLGWKGAGKPLKPVGLVKTGKHHFIRGRNGRERDFIGAVDGTFYEGSLEEVLSRLAYELLPLPKAAQSQPGEE